MIYVDNCTFWKGSIYSSIWKAKFGAGIYSYFQNEFCRSNFEANQLFFIHNLTKILYLHLFFGEGNIFSENTCLNKTLLVRIKKFGHLYKIIFRFSFLLIEGDHRREVETSLMKRKSRWLIVMSSISVENLS